MCLVWLTSRSASRLCCWRSRQIHTTSESISPTETPAPAAGTPAPPCTHTQTDTHTHTHTHRPHTDREMSSRQYSCSAHECVCTHRCRLFEVCASPSHESLGVVWFSPALLCVLSVAPPSLTTQTQHHWSTTANTDHHRTQHTLEESSSKHLHSCKHEDRIYCITCE